MRYLLLGAGLQGRAIAWDLLTNSKDTTEVTVCDINSDSLDAIKTMVNDTRLQTIQLDVSDNSAILPLAKQYDVMISAVN